MDTSNKYYSIGLKKKIVSLVLSGKESVISVSRRYGIGGKMTVYRWIALFQDGQLEESNSPSFSEDMASSKISKKAKYKHTLKADSQSLNESLDKLAADRELEMLRLKVLAYETMIDIAESELGISIRKKSSAKQSPPSEG
jgi:transposase-like protein